MHTSTENNLNSMQKLKCLMQVKKTLNFISSESVLFLDGAKKSMGTEVWYNH